MSTVYLNWWARENSRTIAMFVLSLYFATDKNRSGKSATNKLKTRSMKGSCWTMAAYMSFQFQSHVRPHAKLWLNRDNGDRRLVVRREKQVHVLSDSICKPIQCCVIVRFSNKMKAVFRKRKQTTTSSSSDRKRTKTSGSKWCETWDGSDSHKVTMLWLLHDNSWIK